MTGDALLHVSCHVVTELREGWQLASLAPDAVTDPAALASHAVGWLPAGVPGTVAGALRDAGRDVYREPLALDAHDHWYRCAFGHGARAAGSRYELAFEGLATLSEVWLNGERILESESMFVPHRVDVTDRLRDRNELAIRFRSLDRALGRRRPRPRWRTRLTDHAQLRWFRTSLLGRMPGWSPPLHAVGPYRPVRLIEKRRLDVAGVVLAAEVLNVEQRTGRIRLELSLEALESTAEVQASVVVEEREAALRCRRAGDRAELEGELEIAPVELWWPHTHGDPRLYPVRVRVVVSGEPVEIALGSVGFRRLSLETDAGRFQLRVNERPVFCRGACWTTPDVVTLGAEPQAYGADLERARAAGMNMLRLSGTLCYEQPEFHRRCDELGILVWQDFMFANMDYPIADPSFAAQVDREVTAFLRRTQTHPSLAVVCGGSEVEQQAAMLGLPRELWRSPLFDAVLPAHVKALRPDVPYCPNTPSGGDLPFEANSGVTHYYGVGAYLRDLDDARRAEVQFAAECLAFANVPDDATIESVLPDGPGLVHHPAWKARVPRDSGASWDFEDVRDHYLKLLFGCEPSHLRYADPPRYLALSRVVTGEVMARTFGEWRRARSTCQGALVWFYRDLWPGPGLGVLDSAGRPKAAFYYLRRALASTAVWLSDEGVNGLHVHVAHDEPGTLDAELHLTLHHDATGAVSVAHTVPLQLAAYGGLELRLSGLLPWFADVTRAYRFGPPSHDLVVASLRAGGRTRSEAFYLPFGLPAAAGPDPGLGARALPGDAGSWELQLQSARLAYAVEIDVPGYEPEDNYVHVAPGGTRTIRLQASAAAGAQPPAGVVRALNASRPVKISLEPARATSAAGPAEPREDA